MQSLRRRGRVIALIVGLSALPAAAAAEDRPLRLATIAAASAAAADWASTYHALKYYRVRETNPMLRPFDRSPGAMVSLGAAIDAGAMTTWNMTVGRNHPKVAVVGLWAMTAFRAYLTIHNLRNEQKAGRR